MSGGQIAESTRPFGGFQRPKLSVGLPVHNGLPYLERALDSLLAQDLAEMEIVVCDNASTDGTRSLVEAKAADDSRIRYHRNERNIGGTRNFNRVFQLARGEYFRWAGADDFVSPRALRRCLEALEQDVSAVLAYPETVLVDAEGRPLELQDEGSGWTASTPARRFRFSLTRWWELVDLLYGVIRAEVLEETRLLRHYPSSDLVLVAELSVRGPFRLVEGEFLYRRMHRETSASLDPDERAEFFQPGRDKPFEDKFLRLFRDHARTIWNAPVSPLQKLRMSGSLLRHAVWFRKELGEELRRKASSFAADGSRSRA